MDEKMKFVARWLEHEMTMTDLCHAFGISRDVGYKWVRRYEAEGVDGLKERSRAPLCSPNETPATVVERLLGVRRKHPTWGARKLIAWLSEHERKLALPAASTVTEILKRHGLVAPRQRKWRARPTPTERGMAGGANECWATDFKGQFRTGDGEYCYPLTIQDRYSRFAIRIQSLSAPTEELSRPVYEGAFREHGLPRAMLSDNGSPFAASSLTGLTKLSVWWVSLGIELQRITPGHPEQNGRLERMHRTLKAETTKPPGRDHVTQQRRFATFRRVYNQDRPHDALLGHTPSSAYEPSKRAYPRHAPKPEYSSGVEVRAVNRNGTASFRGYDLNLSSALACQRIGFEPTADGVWCLRFFSFAFASFDERDGLLSAPGGARTCLKAET